MLSLIIPCFNEQESIPIFYEEATKTLKSINNDYEFIFVNDGSEDGTLKILKDLATMDDHVVYLSFPAILEKKPLCMRASATRKEI